MSKDTNAHYYMLVSPYDIRKYSLGCGKMTRMFGSVHTNELLGLSQRSLFCFLELHNAEVHNDFKRYFSDEAKMEEK